MTFVVKHWRGEYSLPISYWAIGFVFGVVSRSSDLIYPYMSDGACLVFLLVWIPVAVWVWVGLWRSAGYRKLDADGKWHTDGWGITARVLVAVAAITSAGAIFQGFSDGLTNQ